MANKCSNPDVKWAIILFPRADPRNLERDQFQTYKLHNTPEMPSCQSTSSPYPSSMKEPLKSGSWPASYAVAKTLIKGDALTVFKQAEIACGTQTVPHFNECLDDVAEHIFSEKAGQIQKCYMQRNLRYTKDLT
eukprot:4936576-Ditylum_brightwellii.AAC.1